MSGLELFERVLEALHEAAFDDARWPVAASLIDEACGSKGNFLVTGDGAIQTDIDIFLARFCYRWQRREDLERLYFGTYHALDKKNTAPTSPAHSQVTRRSEPGGAMAPLADRPRSSLMTSTWAKPYPRATSTRSYWRRRLSRLFRICWGVG